MTTPLTAHVSKSNTDPRRVGRSVAAIVTGFLVVVLLSLGTDQILHMLNVYPPWGQPMWEPGDNLLALGYRSVFTVLGGYVTARLAPSNPMRHVLMLAAIGLVVGVVAAIGTIPMKLGPAWYPIALALTGPAFTWLGGKLHGKPN
jgi:hypothetical protein